MSHALGFPAGENGTVGISADRSKHILGIQGVNCLLGVGEYGGTVGTDSCQLGSGPVEHGHEVITYHMYSGLSQTFQCGNVIVDIFIPVGCTDFDCVVNIDTFDTCKLQSCVLDLFLQGKDVFHFPGFSGSGPVKGGNNAGYSGNLSDLFQSNGVVFAAIPAQCHLHNVILRSVFVINGCLYYKLLIIAIKLYKLLEIGQKLLYCCRRDGAFDTRSALWHAN